MNIPISVIYQSLRVQGGKDFIVDGSQMFVRFVFDLSPDWHNLLTFVQFSQEGNYYNQYLDKEHSVYLPVEIGNGTFTLTLYGTRGTVIATTKTIEFIVKDNIISLNDEGADGTLI